MMSFSGYFSTLTEAFTPKGILKTEKVVCKDQIMQTSQPIVATTGIHAVRPDISIEDIQRSNEQVLFYTGLPDFFNFYCII